MTLNVIAEMIAGKSNKPSSREPYPCIHRPRPPPPHPHEGDEDCTLKGYLVPKGAQVFVNARKLDGDPRAWSGRDSFLPERFLANVTWPTWILRDSISRSSLLAQAGEPALELHLPSSPGDPSSVAQLLQGFDMATLENAPVDMTEGPAKLLEVEEANDEPVYDTYDDEENEVEQEEVTYGDQGKALVVQRILKSAHVEDDKWLQHNIFHTQCTSHGKVCTVIIDSGSCENVISTTMVEKLHLKVEPHPDPYKLSWLKKDNDVHVNKRCLVQFSIGTHYKDEIMCDVVPMNACHLLLGQPWLYDRRVIYDGFKNTYSFVKEGVKIILAPCRMEDKSKAVTGEGSSYLSKSQFLQVLDRSSKASALMLLEENEELGDIPPVVKSLLEKFRNVVPDEIPSGLPPMRDIQHHIDLVLGAAIPSKAAYRMSPKEHEEL
ncbi:hypothetical protein CRG98_014113 [Punica granatum]|uniref:Uncharacterized protein n=1 Tax=Punica granatum TaxID=22663 RepID=A0A2I0KBH3_PUNGR|nr:hypothetical protein CRG98_014113 [Punica granatum]